MSDDIPPLIPETPPPLTKLDWENDEDFMDFPHLALEMTSDSSLSPDSGWNPIDELSLPYDYDVIEKQAGFVGTSDSSLNWPPDIMKNDECLKSPLSEQKSSLHQGNLSTMRNEEDNIKKITSNHSCEYELDYDNKDNISPENILDSNNDKFNSSVIMEQQSSDIDNKNVNKKTLQYLSNVEIQLNNTDVGENNMSETHQEIMGIIHLKSINDKEKSDYVQNILPENVNKVDAKITLPNNMCESLNNNNSINNNNINNQIIQNDSEEYTDFCEFEGVVPNSIITSLPNRTSVDHIENIDDNQTINQVKQISDNHCTISKNISSIVRQNENVDSINLNYSTFEDQQHCDTNSENNFDSEFDEFCDFHTFSKTTAENSDFCHLESNTFHKTMELKHSYIDQEKYVTCNENDNLSLKSDNFNNTSSLKSNSILNSKLCVKIDYKEFCKDAFQGDYDSCEEVDLQNLDFELNLSPIWKNLKDIESSSALNYNWSKSESNNVFLSSLSIDSRNILCGTPWNQKVPRFAANLSNNPLEPSKAFNNAETDIPQFFLNGSLKGTVPDPEFDWKSSGLINPLDIQSDTWKTSDVMNHEDDISVQHSNENLNEFNEYFGTSLSHNQAINIEDSSVSLEAQRILDSFPDFEILQKPYLVILEK